MRGRRTRSGGRLRPGTSWRRSRCCRASSWPGTSATRTARCCGCRRSHSLAWKWHLSMRPLPTSLSRSAPAVKPHRQRARQRGRSQLRTGGRFRLRMRPVGHSRQPLHQGRPPRPGGPRHHQLHRPSAWQREVREVFCVGPVPPIRQ